MLSYNRYHPLAEHMIKCYDAMWPDHPFVFHVPFQTNGSSPPSESLLAAANVVPVESPEPIKATVETLLRGRHDDEWVYWCIDDKYPLAFETESLESTLAWLPSLDPSFQGITLCRCRGLTKQSNLRRSWTRRDEHTRSPWGERFLHRKTLQQFWLPSFLRVGFIRLVFDLIPDGLPQAHLMDNYTGASSSGYRIPAEMKLLVSEKNHMHLGESTSRGELTANVVQSLTSRGFAVPESFPLGGRYIVMP